MGIEILALGLIGLCIFGCAMLRMHMLNYSIYSKRMMVNRE